MCDRFTKYQVTLTTHYVCVFRWKDSGHARISDELEGLLAVSLESIIEDFDAIFHEFLALRSRSFEPSGSIGERIF